MNSEVTVQEAARGSEEQQDLTAQLAAYVEQQPASKQALHRWMKVLEVGGIAIILDALAFAIYASVQGAVFETQEIVAAWFLFIASFTPLLALFGLHAAVLGAFPPIVPPAFSQQQLDIGGKAAGTGLGFGVLAVIVGAFWSVFAYAIWSSDIELALTLGKILGTLMAAAIVISVVSSLYRQFFRSR